MADTSAIAEYKRIIGKCRKLTRQEEIAAWERGDNDLLAESVLPYAMKIATQMCRQRLAMEFLEDAIGAANCGVARSLTTYDAKETRLTTYVTQTIRWAVGKELVRQMRGLGPPAGTAAKFDIATPKLLGDHDESVVAKVHVDEWEDERRLLNAAINTLPPKQKVVIEHRMQGVQLKDIACLLGISAHAAFQRNLNAKQSIRDWLSMFPESYKAG